ncbi:MAG: hypothetical protein MZU97_00360 [Bacillus subtilis]|nr:hypothetical protein [Bacillus subtilis]
MTAEQLSMYVSAAGSETHRSRSSANDLISRLRAQVVRLYRIYPYYYSPSERPVRLSILACLDRFSNIIALPMSTGLKTPVARRWAIIALVRRPRRPSFRTLSGQDVGPHRLPDAKRLSSARRTARPTCRTAHTNALTSIRLPARPAARRFAKELVFDTLNVAWRSTIRRRLAATASSTASRKRQTDRAGIVRTTSASTKASPILMLDNCAARQRPGSTIMNASNHPKRISKFSTSRTKEVIVMAIDQGCRESRRQSRFRRSPTRSTTIPASPRITAGRESARSPPTSAIFRRAAARNLKKRCDADGACRNLRFRRSRLSRTCSTASTDELMEDGTTR